mmetsp:Transcript_38108/g.76962  ORF Transcript_38108/g.76962 Transcript_38108/m.76962 type:complete len:585 (+) Transcript_38108:143-1897(+)
MSQYVSTCTSKDVPTELPHPSCPSLSDEKVGKNTESLGEKPEGLPKEPDPAVEKIRKCAARGDAHSQYVHALMHKNGLGDLAVDHDKATAWLLEAAERGHADAMNELGLQYSEGRGSLRKDHWEALRWFKPAAAQGVLNARKNVESLLRYFRQDPAGSGGSARPLTVGTRVVVCGLKGRPELNTEPGVVTKGFASCSPTGCRVGVTLADGRGPFNVKAENLAVLPPPPEPRPQPPLVGIPGLTEETAGTATTGPLGHTPVKGGFFHERGFEERIGVEFVLTARGAHEFPTVLEVFEAWHGATLQLFHALFHPGNLAAINGEGAGGEGEGNGAALGEVARRLMEAMVASKRFDFDGAADQRLREHGFSEQSRYVSAFDSFAETVACLSEDGPFEDGCWASAEFTAMAGLWRVVGSAFADVPSNPSAPHAHLVQAAGTLAEAWGCVTDALFGLPENGRSPGSVVCGKEGDAGEVRSLPLSMVTVNQLWAALYCPETGGLLSTTKTPGKEDYLDHYGSLCPRKRDVLRNQLPPLRVLSDRAWVTLNACACAPSSSSNGGGGARGCEPLEMLAKNPHFRPPSTGKQCH